MADDNYRWEGDPHETPKTPQHQAMVREGFYTWLKNRGVIPGDAISGRTPEDRADYASWLKQQSAKAPAQASE